MICVNSNKCHFYLLISNASKYIKRAQYLMMCRRKRVNVSNVNYINDTINDIFINIVRKMCQIAAQNDTQLHLPSLQRIILHCIHAAINDNVDRYMGIRINCKTAFFFHQLF